MAGINVTFTIDEQASIFNYLIVNPSTGQAEMHYHIEFQADNGKRYTLQGTKYMQRTGAGGVNAIRELLLNYTTLYCHVFRLDGDTNTEIGTALMKFRTFENLAATGSLVAFLASFTVSGTNDPMLRLQAQMRFVAFTAQFVQRTYDPLSPDMGTLLLDVRSELLRGAATPDYFSTRLSADLQTILRDTPTLPLEKLINTRNFSVDIANRRINRDIFWKGSFAKDGLLGWEERVRNAGLSEEAARAGQIFTGGSFWKRFDQVQDGIATGHVVNYDLDALPGDPQVRLVAYPDDNRRYFRKGDNILLLTYLNDPYKQIYDTIKVVDENNVIAVMHLGEFPNGVEVATFVMERYSYAFEDMSIEDYQMLLQRADLSKPAPTQLPGAWTGNFIYLEHPNTALLDHASHAPVSLTANPDSTFEISLADGTKLKTGGSLAAQDMRMVGNDTILGKWESTNLDAAALRALRDYMVPYTDAFVFYYVLRQAQAGAAVVP